MKEKLMKGELMKEEQQKLKGDGKERHGGRLRAVGLVSLATMLSRILGLVRDMIFAALFKREATDAYTVAFLLPNLLRRLLAEGILSTAFVPVFTDYVDKDEEERRRAYGATLSLFVLVLLFITILGVVLAPLLIKIFAPGYVGYRYELAVYLTRLMFPFIFLVGIASFWTGILHTLRHFTMPALGPLALNVGIICCALLLRHLFPESRAIAAMAVGVLVGGFLQLFLQVVVLKRMGIAFRLRWEVNHPAIKDILRLMGPTLLGLGIYQLNLLVGSSIASMLQKGSVTYIYYSNRLMELPLGVIAVAFATVSLPALAEKAEKKDWKNFHDILMFGIRGVLFVCIPAAFGLFVLKEEIIAVLFQRGRFTALDTMKCAVVFAPAAFGLIAAGTLRNLTPAFYAMKDTKKPVKVAFWSFVINATLSFLLAFPLKWKALNLSFGLDLGASGLTLANALSALFSVIFSFYLLQGKLGRFDLRPLWRSAYRVLLASVVMAVGVWWLKGQLFQAETSLWRLGRLGFLVAFGSVLFFGMAFWLKVPELSLLARKLRAKM